MVGMVTSEVVHDGSATIVQGGSEIEVSCSVTAQRQMLDSLSGPVEGQGRWGGHFSRTSGELDAAYDGTTTLRLPGGRTNEIGLTTVTVNESGTTQGTFVGRGRPPRR
jgi:hypothetical protein